MVLLCSDDRLASPDEITFDELRRLRSAAPSDRRSEPITDVQPLQVSPLAVRVSLQSFHNGSAAGPDGLRPQHLKDLLLGAPNDNQLLSAVTDLTNLLLEGKTPPSVRQLSSQKQWYPADCYRLRLETNDVESHMQLCRVVSTTLQAPRQLGFRFSGWIEAAIRACSSLLPGNGNL